MKRLIKTNICKLSFKQVVCIILIDLLCAHFDEGFLHDITHKITRSRSI